MLTRLARTAAHVAAPLALLALALAPSAEAQDFETHLLGTSAGRLTAIEFAPGVTDQLYTAEKAGRIFRFRDGNYVGTAVLDIRSIVTDAGEGGLIGFVFDPNFETNGHFYVAYCTTSGTGDSVVSRFTMMPGSVDIADPNSEQILFGPYPQTTNGHKGGDLEFGPDGMLYHAIGDGDAGSAMNLDTARDLSDPRGKILRLDVKAPHPHVPADNPFVGVAGANELIWAYGFRNPYRLEVDSISGDVYVADVGTTLWEEVTRLPASNPGMTGGWPCKEGFQCKNYDALCDCADANEAEPIMVQSHGGTDMSCAVMGGIVVHDPAIPSLDGSYLFADFCSGRFYRIDDPAGAANTVEISADVNGGTAIRFCTDFTAGPDGAIYFVAHYGSEVWQLKPSGGFDVYCSATANSTGSAASLVASGSPSVSVGDLQLSVTSLPANALGLFLMSQSQVFVPLFGGSEGNLCVGSPIYRWSPTFINSDAAGTVSLKSDLTDLPPTVTFLPGDTWNFQYWTRDANPGVTSNTSNGAVVQFVP